MGVDFFSDNCAILQSVFSLLHHIGTAHFTFCVLLSTIDFLSLNEARRISKCALIHTPFLHHDSALFLRVRGHVRLLCSFFICDFPDS